MVSFLSRLLPILSLALLAGCQKAPTTQAKGPAAPPAVPVSATQAARESVPTELRVVGTVEASSIVQVKSQVAGQLLRVAFTEGQNVAKGDLLFEIDPRPFQEALRQAEAPWAATGRRSPRRRRCWRATPRRPNSTRATPPATPSWQRPAWSRGRSPTRRKTSADVSREAAARHAGGHRERQAALESDLSAVATAKLNLELLRDPRADFRPHRESAGARRKSGEGERRAAGRHQPGVADVRQFQPCRSSTLPPSGGSAPTASWRCARSRRTIPERAARRHRCP